MTSLRPNGEGSIFPYRNGFAACVWITTPLGKRQRKYVYGRTREIVHGRWVELTRKAARGPVVTKVPTIGQFIHRWLEETVAPNLAPLTYATYETHVKNYIEPESGPGVPPGGSCRRCRSSRSPARITSLQSPTPRPSTPASRHSSARTCHRSVRPGRLSRMGLRQPGRGRPECRSDSRLAGPFTDRLRGGSG